jgi:ribosomal protein L17
MKTFIELFELVIQSAKKTKDAKKLKEITKIGEELSVLAKNPDKITEAQVAILADKLKEFQQGVSKGEGVASLDISDDQRQINQIIKKGDSYDEPATLAYTEKKIDPNDPDYFVKTAEEARIQVEQEAKSLFDNGVFTKEQYLDELGRIKEEYGEGSSLFISSQKADGTYETPSVTNRPQGKSADMYDSAERSIQFVAEKTGLSFEEARLAIMEKMNEGYAIGDPKRRGPNELASIKAYLDVNLDYSATDAIQFLEDIEEIAFSGSIDLASDTAKNVSKQNAKQIIDSSLPGDEFGETLIDFDKVTPIDDLTEDFKRLDDITEDDPFKSLDEFYKKETGVDYADDAPKTLEDTFENVPPERRAMMEEMYAPIIEEQKIIEATQKEIQETAAKIQDLIEQGRVDEAEALAESLKDFQTQLKSTDSALDATIIPPNRTLNAKGGSIGISSLFKRK